MPAGALGFKPPSDISRVLENSPVRSAGWTGLGYRHRNARLNPGAGPRPIGETPSPRGGRIGACSLDLPDISHSARARHLLRRRAFSQRDT